MLSIKLHCSHKIFIRQYIKSILQSKSYAITSIKLVSSKRFSSCKNLRNIFFVLFAVVALFFIEWLAINVSILSELFEVRGMLFVVIVFFAGIGVVGWRMFVKAGRRATKRFEEALTAEERNAGLERMTTVSVPEGTIHRLELRANSPAIGESVVSLNIRAKTGASVVSVIRNGQITRNIGPDWEFAISDVVVAIGDPPQIAALKDLLGVTS